MDLDAAENEIIDQLGKLKVDRQRRTNSVGYDDYKRITETIEWRKALIRELIKKAGLTPDSMQ